MLTSILPFEIQAAVISGMAVATKSDSGSDSSLDNVVKIQLQLEQVNKYIFFEKLMYQFCIPPRITWPKPRGTIE